MKASTTITPVKYIWDKTFLMVTGVLNKLYYRLYIKIRFDI